MSDKLSFKEISLCKDLFFCLAALVIVPITLVALSYPPTIPSQGVAHRIFYIHVPIAWVALYAPLFSAFCGVLYLVTRRERYDIWSLTHARIAYLFALAVLISGPLWASTEWGVYWNWKDSRLVSFFVLFLTLSAYFLLRKLSDDPLRKRSSAAVVTLLAASTAVLTWFSIRWIEPDTHPPSVLGKMSEPIALTFFLSVFAYHLLFLVFLCLALRHEQLRRLCWQYAKISSAH